MASEKKELGISLEELWNYLTSGEHYYPSCSIKTDCGYQLRRSLEEAEDEVEAFYDLLDNSNGDLLCMDGESVEIVSRDETGIVLRNTEENTIFKLSEKEFSESVFSEPVIQRTDNELQP